MLSSVIKPSTRIQLAQCHTPILKEKGLPLLGSLPEFAKSPLNFFNRLTLEYTGVVEFSLATMDAALVIDGDIAHKILVKEAKTFRKGDRDIQIMGTILGNGLVTNNHTTKHKIQRKLVQPGFHFRRVQSYSKIMSDYTTSYIDSWQDGRRDISDDMFKLTMSIVCKTLFDIDMESIEKDADDIGQTMKVVQSSINSKFNQLFFLPDWVPTPNNIRLNRARKKLYSTIESMIHSRQLETSPPTGQIKDSPKRDLTKADLNDKGDMMSMLLQAKYEDGSSMDTKLVMDELITLFVAGHETTSNALSWTFYLLAQHPEIQLRLQTELDSVLQGADADFSHLEQLTYCEMVVKESMRLLPPVWTLNARQANEDIVVGDYFFPKDKVVFISPYSNHRNPKYFKQPENFDPERFSPENEKLIPKHVYIPFGAGPRVCIGQSFAMMEAKIILASIMQRFSITLDKQQSFDPLAQITLSNDGGMNIHIRKR